MPIWLEILFSIISSISFICSIIMWWQIVYKNRISRKTLILQEIILGETKYSYDEHDYLKHIKVKLVLHNSTEKSLLLSKCKIADYPLFKLLMINDDYAAYNEILGITIPPTSSTEIDGIIKVNSEIDKQTLNTATLNFSNGKQIKYSMVQQFADEPH